MPVPAIAIRNLTKRYGDLVAVNDLSLEVPEGEFFGFLGPNGAGKTTTISAVVGLCRFEEGQIEIFGHDAVHDYRSARRLVGLAPQEYNFDRYLTIREELLYQAGYYGIPRRAVVDRADELLHQFGLYEKRDVDFTKLSGGMKRRLTLARALVHWPRILILDEPTSGVDVELRLELWDWLRQLNRQGVTIFLTTHYIEEAERLCNTIGIINEGRMIALDRTTRLLDMWREETVTVTLAAPPDGLPPELLAYHPRVDRETMTFCGLRGEHLYPLLGLLERHGLVVRDIAIARSTLQDVFLKLTGRGQTRRECGDMKDGE